MHAGWLVPTLAYVTAVGALGVASKVALRSLSWRELVVWLGAGYAVVVATLLALGDAQLQIVGDTFWAVVSAVLVVGGLVVLFVALETGEASKVVPVSSAYPAVTLVLSGLFLAEPLTLASAGGVALVIAGVVVLTAGR